MQAQLRNLKKIGYRLNKRNIIKGGCLFEYQLLAPVPDMAALRAAALRGIAKYGAPDLSGKGGARGDTDARAMAGRTKEGDRRLGCSRRPGEKYGCPRALFYDKTGVEPDYQHSEASLDLFARGHALEPLIADRFSQETGSKVRRMPARVAQDKPWMRVNVDRIILSVARNGPGYLECKTANEHVFADMLAHGVPEHYVLQSQHGLAVTRWKWGAFAVLEPYTFNFLWFRFERNEKLISVIEHEEEAFWQMVKSGTIPAKLADFADARCGKCVWRRGCRNAEALPKVAGKARV